MKPLKAYIKNPVSDAGKLDAHTRSILITKTQAEFLRVRGVNLSALVRDLLDDLIKKTESSPTTGDKK